MRSRRRIPAEDERWAPLAARITELEDRIRILEARVREVTAQARKDAALNPVARKPPAARTRPRPRCPGCTLERPKGRQGDYCVWCGFMFSAVKSRARR